MGLEDVFTSFAEGSRRSAGPAQLFKFTSLSANVQTHLVRVYTTLALALAICAGGVWLSGALAWTAALGTLGLFASVTWFSMTPAQPQNRRLRQRLLAAAALSQGLVIGPLVNASLAIAPGVAFSAALATAAVFACFSAAALLSPRRQYLYLGGYCGAALSGLLILQLGSWLFGGQMLLFQAHLYLGLLVFSAYVVYDTQVIIERAEAGIKDELRDALSLFVDAVAIFVRVLIILMRKAQEEKQREEGRRRRKTRLT